MKDNEERGMESYYRKFAGHAKKANITDILPPTFFCETCNYCENSRCTIYKRPVCPDYNRCTYHTDYTPIRANFIRVGLNSEYKYA